MSLKRYILGIAAAAVTATVLTITGTPDGALGPAGDLPLDLP